MCSKLNYCIKLSNKIIAVFVKKHRFPPYFDKFCDQNMCKIFKKCFIKSLPIFSMLLCIIKILPKFQLYSIGWFKFPTFSNFISAGVILNVVEVFLTEFSKIMFLFTHLHHATI